ncbi:DnaJ-domain-containing protein, partial [Schizopora paradoxa]
STFPDYYDILSVSPDATDDDIRTAYKRESLRSHPDRLANATPQEKKRATERFQALADAYYVLRDPTRRKEYDSLRGTRPRSERTADPTSSANFFANFAQFFSGANAPAGGAGADAGGRPQRPDAEGVFGDVFEELLRPEVERHYPFWAWLGAFFGAGLGFIIANIPGLLAGGYAGNRLGAIRDAKGKSVAAVFSSLGGSQKAEILRALAMKVLGT